MYLLETWNPSTTGIPSSLYGIPTRFTRSRKEFYMNELTVFEQDGKLLTDSREVAVMVDKPHNDLMKSIRSYIEYLGCLLYTSLNAHGTNTSDLIRLPHLH